MRPEIRRRGIYDVQVYSNDLNLSGDFSNVDETLNTFFVDGRRYDVHWSQAALSVGLSEPKGIVGIENLEAMDHSYDFLPGTLLTDTLQRQTPVADRTPVQESDKIQWSLSIVWSCQQHAFNLTIGLIS